jgi:hypothetical protein
MEDGSTDSDNIRRDDLLIKKGVESIVGNPDRKLHEMLKLCEHRYIVGDTPILLLGLKICLEEEIPVPESLKIGFCDLVEKALSGKYRSWDDVFGKPLPKGRHIGEATRLDDSCNVYLAVEKEKLKGAPVDSKLFEKVGKDLAIGGKSTTDGLYYKVKHALDENHDIFKDIVAVAISSDDVRRVRVCKNLIKYACTLTSIPKNL